MRAKIKADKSIIEEPSGSERFETYFSNAEAKQWTITTKSDAAYPAVTCTHVYNSAGGTDMTRQMRCDASREECDALFKEFDANDARVREQVRAR